MTSMLPSMAAIRVFEAAARHGSFTKAAEELGMTQAAVSYQIKALEERIGAPLFLRRPRQVELTDRGRQLASVTTEAFELLRSAYGSVQDEADGRLVISSLQTFSVQWLTRHLGDFQDEFPGISLQLETSNKVVDFYREDVDVAIRGGGGQWPGLRSHKLVPVKFAPMLSPQLLDRIGGLDEPSDLLKLDLLGAEDPWWAEWFAQAGVTEFDLQSRRRNCYGSQFMEANAAMAGQGAAILTPALYQRELEQGVLVQPFDLVCEADHGYWLVYPETRRNAPRIRAFRDWILKEVVKTGLTA